MNKKISIAIDGPASAGKSTVAKILAKNLNYIYCDTGAMYRSLTYLALKNHCSFEDEAGLLILLNKMHLEFVPTLSGQLVYANGENISLAIRQPDVTKGVSAVSAHRLIREKFVIRQQEIAKSGGIVMDGRDIGTKVLPNAEVKIFLVASVEERAQRRYRENLAQGIAADFETLKQEIEKRDFMDSTRKESPLTQAADAVMLDTTGMTIEDVVKKITKIVQEKVKS